MHDFSLATLGGLAIGAAAVLMMALLGRVTGISGIFWTGLSQAMNRTAGILSWQMLFVLGMVSGAFLAHRAFGLPLPPVSEHNLLVAIVAGWVVGFGTNLGSGCTSGHGVCGISRFSPRSIFATLTFMFAGFATVFALRHLLPVVT
ncbi:MAG: YeeE/YedE family protein [Arenicella sp.]|nr:YeeE/YedE family protein [Arenicella sp.]